MRRFPHHWVWPALIVSGLAYARFGPNLATVCPAQLLFDVPCPACGGTRAVRALVRADLAAALGFNPLVTIGALSGLLYTVLAPAAVLAGRAPPQLSPRGRAVQVARWLLPSALLANWLYLLWGSRV